VSDKAYKPYQEKGNGSASTSQFHPSLGQFRPSTTAQSTANDRSYEPPQPEFTSTSHQPQSDQARCTSEVAVTTEVHANARSKPGLVSSAISGAVQSQSHAGSAPPTAETDSIGEPLPIVPTIPTQLGDEPEKPKRSRARPKKAPAEPKTTATKKTAAAKEKAAKVKVAKDKVVKDTTARKPRKKKTAAVQVDEPNDATTLLEKDLGIDTNAEPSSIYHMGGHRFDGQGVGHGLGHDIEMDDNFDAEGASF